ncbi:hypothetical protein [Gephyromycinifex aptenodytis]|uniref:hypothetical protein n=1 Tax=Gephyromycinifex aptenodytis TaxID=2716227 RepID=UPI0014481A4C|nr:hypothetical protein [Gephyromycinifex aptenodytis]
MTRAQRARTVFAASSASCLIAASAFGASAEDAGSEKGAVQPGTNEWTTAEMVFQNVDQDGALIPGTNLSAAFGGEYCARNNEDSGWSCKSLDTNDASSGIYQMMNNDIGERGYTDAFIRNLGAPSVAVKGQPLNACLHLYARYKADDFKDDKTEMAVCQTSEGWVVPDEAQRAALNLSPDFPNWQWNADLGSWSVTNTRSKDNPTRGSTTITLHNHHLDPAGEWETQAMSIRKVDPEGNLISGSKGVGAVFDGESCKRDVNGAWSCSDFEGDWNLSGIKSSGEAKPQTNVFDNGINLDQPITHCIRLSEKSAPSGFVRNTTKATLCQTVRGWVVPNSEEQKEIGSIKKDWDWTLGDWRVVNKRPTFTGGGGSFKADPNQFKVTKKATPTSKGTPDGLQAEKEERIGETTITLVNKREPLDQWTTEKMVFRKVDGERALITGEPSTGAQFGAELCTLSSGAASWTCEEVGGDDVNAALSSKGITENFIDAAKVLETSKNKGDFQYCLRVWEERAPQGYTPSKSQAAVCQNSTGWVLPEKAKQKELSAFAAFKGWEWGLGNWTVLNVKDDPAKPEGKATFELVNNAKIPTSDPTSPQAPTPSGPQTPSPKPPVAPKPTDAPTTSAPKPTNPPAVEPIPNKKPLPPFNAPVDKKLLDKASPLTSHLFAGRPNAKGNVVLYAQVDNYTPRTAKQARIVNSLARDGRLGYREDRALWGASKWQIVRVEVPENSSWRTLIGAINAQTKAPIGDVLTLNRAVQVKPKQTVTMAWVLGDDATPGKPWGPKRNINQVYLGRS